MNRAIGRIAVAFLVTLSMVAMSSPVAAQSSDQPDWADDLFADFEEMQPRYNENIGDADMNFAQRQIYNQITGNIVNVYLVGTDVTYSFRMRSDGRITDLQQSRRDDADLRMQMTRDTAEDLAAADNPVPLFVTAAQNGAVVRRNGERTVRGIVINGADGKPIKQATWTVVNTVKGLL
ncbi:hypothetical protein [Haloplanus sp.]|uniref:hypothetical protein n=1 Tax=Haloplanus sp. TaxID=1961696 RepID=UPI002632C2A9|nr:hypothetical protein [Haloplanus sp.]